MDIFPLGHSDISSDLQSLGCQKLANESLENTKLTSDWLGAKIPLVLMFGWLDWMKEGIC